MNDLEFTDLKNALDNAIHILASSNYDEDCEKLREIITRVKKDQYGLNA